MGNWHLIDTSNRDMNSSRERFGDVGPKPEELIGLFLRKRVQIVQLLRQFPFLGESLVDLVVSSQSDSATLRLSAPAFNDPLVLSSTAVIASGNDVLSVAFLPESTVSPG